MLTTAYIALGSNLGDKLSNLNRSLALTNSAVAARVERVATPLITQPVGGPAGQPEFLNSAAAVQTELSAREFLQMLLQIEKAMGRNRDSETRNGPRIIDLDLLLFADQIISAPGITVPHPRMHQRLFVLDPLCQIAPDVVHPVLQKTIRQLLQELRNSSKIGRL